MTREADSLEGDWWRRYLAGLSPGTHTTSESMACEMTRREYLRLLDSGTDLPTHVQRCRLRAESGVLMHKLEEPEKTIIVNILRYCATLQRLLEKRGENLLDYAHQSAQAIEKSADELQRTGFLHPPEEAPPSTPGLRTAQSKPKKGKPRRHAEGTHPWGDPPPTPTTGVP